MLDDTQIERLATAASALRPAWSVKSLTAFLDKHRHRTYRDLAVALAWIAADPKIQTPGKLNTGGAWWDCTATERGEDLERYRMRCPEHPRQPAGRCQACEAMRAEPPPQVRRDIQRTLDRWKATRPRPRREPDNLVAVKRARRPPDPPPADQEAAS